MVLKDTLVVDFRVTSASLLSGGNGSFAVSMRRRVFLSECFPAPNNGILKF